MPVIQQAIAQDIETIQLEQIQGLGASIGIAFTVIPSNPLPILPSPDHLAYITISFDLHEDPVFITQTIPATLISSNLPIPLEGIYYPGGTPFTEEDLPISNIQAILYYYPL